MKEFYVYTHKDPLTDCIVYIGKGKGKRAFHLEHRNKKHSEWLQNLKCLELMPKIEILEYFDTEKEAFEKEKELIKLHKGKYLTNMHSGGTGFAGENNGAFGIKRPDLAKRNADQKGKTLEEI